MTASTSSESPPLWKRGLGYFGGAFLGAVLLVAAWAKTLDPEAFARQITLEGLDFLLPAMAVALIALALEVFLGAALLLGLRRLWILVPTTGLVAFFVFLNLRSYYRFTQGIVPEEGCGCFGNLVERTPAEALWQDLLLMLPALGLAWLGHRATRGWPRWRLVAATALTLATVVVAWKAPELPLDDLATRLKPGVDALELCAGSEDDGTHICLDALLPALAEGEHLVVMAEIGDGGLDRAQVDRLNQYLWSADGGPRLWVIAAATPEELFAFRFQQGPAFEVHEVPSALLKPLYRTLPRSFLARDGEVVETYAGLPPQIPRASSEADSLAQTGSLGRKS